MRPASSLDLLLGRLSGRLAALSLTGLTLLLLTPPPALARQEPESETPEPVMEAQAAATEQAPPDPVGNLLFNLPWRNIGPAIMGGRINDIAPVESDPRIVYVATAAGGVMKTVNHGTTWEMVFDKEVTGSIGDLAVAPSAPQIIYAGTGEANNRQSSSWGHGIYKSTDAGKTWQHLGLTETMHIGRVVVHPTNPEIVYVAAVGRLWGPNPERGLFKTSDGGKTWEKVLFINDDTGCTDVILDHKNPEVLIAATYQRRRTAFGFAGGGPGSGLHRSTDGGKTWSKLEKGLPPGPLGRIGLANFHQNPSLIYAIIETKNSGSTQNALGGGIWRSADGGVTWEKRSDTNPRPMYFSQIRVDPNHSEKVWVLGVQTYLSTDGAKTFRSNLIRNVHADGHALWINPADSRHVILGTDGGMQWSWDGGETWNFANNIPISQFYEVHYDFQQPFWVYGGLQDNGSWGAPSRTLIPGRGVTNDEWINVGGGDGFYAQADPRDPSILYTESQQGNLRRLNVTTGESKSIRPRALPGETLQFDWNTPLLISPHNPRKLLVGANRLFISTDRGDTWRRSDDLTTKPDRSKLPIFGAPVTRDTLSANDGQSSFGQIVTVTESPAREGVIYVGTDDGNLQVSTDDGKTWKNVAGNVPGLPRGTYVTRVVASHHAAGRCYATFDGHRSDDFKPYIYVTEDYGQTWKPLSAGLPEGGTLSVVREHHREPGLLFIGTERGVYVSLNRGEKWHRFGAPFPASIPVDDIQIHPRDNALILGTHARGIWILDDLGPFETLARQASLAGPALAPPAPAVAWRLANRKGVTGHALYIAPNPPSGAQVSFYLPDAPAGSDTVRLSVLSRDGKTVIRQLRVPRLRQGWNRITWDLRHNPPVSVPAGNGRQSRGAVAGLISGPRVLPGSYQVRLQVGETEQTQPILVGDDPRITVSEKDRKALFDSQMRLNQFYASADSIRRSLVQTRGQLEALEEKAAAALKPELTGLIGRIEALERQIAASPRRSGAGGGSPGQRSGQTPGQTPRPTTGQPAERTVEPPLTLRLGRLLSTLDSFTEPLSPASREEIKKLESEYRSIAATVNQLNTREIPALNRRLTEASLPPVKPGALIAEE